MERAIKERFKKQNYQNEPTKMEIYNIRNSQNKKHLYMKHQCSDATETIEITEFFTETTERTMFIRTLIT